LEVVLRQEVAKGPFSHRVEQPTINVPKRVTN